MSTLLRTFRPARPGWIVDTPIAHRGLHDATKPENTRAAFDAAVAAGYAIELDVHASRDGVVVVFHDATLDRLTEHTGRVRDYEWSTLRTMRIAGTDETIPSLREIMTRVAGRVPVVVEIKNEGDPGRLERQVAADLTGTRKFCVQSFNPMSLAWFRRNAPEVPRGLLSTDFVEESLPRYKKLLLRNLLLAPLVAPSYVGYDLRCLPFWAPTLSRHLGLPLLAWTVRSEADLLRARCLADNVIFEGVRP
ncbi:MAG: glycerophosphodiester phosphodiesterase family protein [Myxococcota bacterium]